MPNTPESLGGISSDAVRAKTGKDWSEWLAALDAENAQTLKHKQIAALLSTKYAVRPWWSQMVTVGYEQARGLRAVHQKTDGYSASASKTFRTPLPDLYRAFTDEALRAKWLGRKQYTITKTTLNKSVRMAWGKAGATRVGINLYAKGKTKSQIALEHEKLGSADEVAQMKKYWQGAFEKLGALIEK
jgi:hypothetical protein